MGEVERVSLAKSCEPSQNPYCQDLIDTQKSNKNTDINRYITKTQINNKIAANLGRDIYTNLFVCPEAYKEALKHTPSQTMAL